MNFQSRLGYYTPLTYPMDIAGIVVMEEPAGAISSQGMQMYPAAQWENHDQLWWTPEKQGDRIKLAVVIPDAGKYSLLTRLTKAPDYGIVQFYLNERKIGKPIDLYHKDAVTATEQIDLGIHQLKKGRSVLTAEMIGSHPDAIRRYMFGMDYLKIQKQSSFSVGEFSHIYDPSIGEQEKWYINDHCFIYGPDKQWHLFGITRQEPARPAEEDNFAHAVSNDLYSADGWTKKPFALSVDSNAGEAHLWAPYVIEHEGLYYMYYCAGGRTSQEYQLKLATSKDLYTWQRHPANPMFIDGCLTPPRPLHPEARRQMDHVLYRHQQTRRRQPCCRALESKDLIHWGNKKPVFTDPSVGRGAGQPNRLLLFAAAVTITSLSAPGRLSRHMRLSQPRFRSTDH
jgi:hypothetical protein